MAKSKKKREIVHLVCSESGERNYTIRKRAGTPKLSLSTRRSPSMTSATSPVHGLAIAQIAVKTSAPALAIDIS